MITNPRLFSQEINYNGYKRNIICFNPPLVDDEGDIIEDEDEIEEGDASPLEDNIYEEIKLEGQFRRGHSSNQATITD